MSNILKLQQVDEQDNTEEAGSLTSACCASYSTVSTACGAEEQ